MTASAFNKLPFIGVKTTDHSGYVIEFFGRSNVGPGGSVKVTVKDVWKLSATTCSPGVMETQVVIPPKQKPFSRDASIGDHAALQEFGYSCTSPYAVNVSSTLKFLCPHCESVKATEDRKLIDVGCGNDRSALCNDCGSQTDVTGGGHESGIESTKKNSNEKGSNNKNEICQLCKDKQKKIKKPVKQQPSKSSEPEPKRNLRPSGGSKTNVKPQRSTCPCKKRDSESKMETNYSGADIDKNKRNRRRGKRSYGTRTSRKNKSDTEMETSSVDSDFSKKGDEEIGCGISNPKNEDRDQKKYKSDEEKYGGCASKNESDESSKENLNKQCSTCGVDLTGGIVKYNRDTPEMPSEGLGKLEKTFYIRESSSNSEFPENYRCPSLNADMVIFFPNRKLSDSNCNCCTDSDCDMNIDRFHSEDCYSGSDTSVSATS